MFRNFGLGGFPFRLRRSFNAADTSVLGVDGLQHVKVKLFARRNADVEAVPLDGFVDALRISRQHLLRSFERGIIERRGFDRSEDCLLFFGKCVRGSTEEGGGEESDFCHVVGFYDAATDAGAAICDAPPCLIGVVIKLPVQSDGFEPEFLSRLRNEAPGRAAGDPLAGAVGLCCAVDFRPRPDDEPSCVIDVLGDEANNGSLDRSGIHGDHGFAGDQTGGRC